MGLSLMSALIWMATQIPVTAHLTPKESRYVDEVAKGQNRPKIDVNIHFDLDSAAITSTAELQLNELCVALRSPDLENSLIVIIGHTDARGSAAYKQELSERRAKAVKQYLVEKCKYPEKNLDTLGYGPRRLKNEADPFGQENNRVEIVNLGTAARK